MSSNIYEGIEAAYRERTDLLVVALTGRTGSGCTTAAEILSRPFADVSTTPSDLSEPERRKLDIAKRLCAKQWEPFKIITVSTLIFGCLLAKSNIDIAELLKEHKVGDIKKILNILDELREQPTYNDFSDCVKNGNHGRETGAWCFYNDSLRTQAHAAKIALTTQYTSIFQTLGNNIRLSGDPLSSDIAPSQLFSLIRYVKRLAKAAFKHEQMAKTKSVRIVIDAVRNSLELVYLRDQFAAFYAMAVTCDDEDRVERLEQMNLTKNGIKSIDDREYSENKNQLDSYDNFVSQNLQDCIQKADIFIANSGKSSEFNQNKRYLNAQLIRYVALMLRPGLVTPTREERCMQLAFVAKLNSGCISRQVGAAVADENYSIKAVGWNDVPKGQVPCLLRDVDELVTGGDVSAFSKFEKTDKAFLAQLNQTYSNRAELKEVGLPCPYCFKREYNKSRKTDNQVHTRSLHAEENAFLQLVKHGNSGIERGYLYTTASPCELCSKKAFQLGIREIVYVDPYPGISSTHILSSGDENARPKMKLFSGAVGHAYHRLYGAILPIKDEYLARLSNDPQQVLFKTSSAT